MSGLRPSSVCDTTPLQRLESQSSSSEPSSPTSSTLNGVCIGDHGGGGGGNGVDAFTGETFRKVTHKKFSLSNHNNNKIGIRLQNFCGESMKMDVLGTRKVCCRVLLDALILVCVILPILYYRYWGEPYKRGFFCNDESLKHPYRDSTVKNWMLYMMGLVAPVSVVVTIEFFKSNENKMLGIDNMSAARYYFWHLEISNWIIECYKVIGVLTFGIGIGQLTADISKYSLGRLRPHFFAVCQPILSDGTTCDHPKNAGCYIEDFDCLAVGMTEKMLRQASLAFPSGHATFGFFTMIYIMIYLQARMTWPRLKMFKHLLQFLCLMCAWYTALTRISDYKHHWSDVLVGSTLGTFYAFALSYAMW